jgi:hypothetical protein
MQKTLLFSILLMTIVLPALAAREPRPLLAIRRAVGWMVAGVVLYVLGLVFVYPRLLG